MQVIINRDRHRHDTHTHTHKVMSAVYKHFVICGRACARWWHRIRNAKPKNTKSVCLIVRAVTSATTKPRICTRSNADWFINRSAQNHFTYSKTFSGRIEPSLMNKRGLHCCCCCFACIRGQFFGLRWKCDGGYCQSRAHDACFTCILYFVFWFYVWCKL